MNLKLPPPSPDWSEHLNVSKKMTFNRLKVGAMCRATDGDLRGQDGLPFVSTEDGRVSLRLNQNILWSFGYRVMAAVLNG